MSDWIGYRWLAETYGVAPVQAFRVSSRIDRSRSTDRKDGYVAETYTEQSRPANRLAAHLAFALKREGVHLEFLARLFDVLPPTELDIWIAAEPTGQYARRACFFYEYLTGRRLVFGGVKTGNYVDALDRDDYVTATQATNNPHWRVRDNLPGTRDYCPTVLRTDGVKAAEDYDCARQLAALDTKFGADLLLRSAVWLTSKESAASFAIEHESHQVDRIQRFAAVMERAGGVHAEPLSERALEDLQRQILGPNTIRHGMRRSPVFVGENDPAGQVVHYIAPHWDDTHALLAGLREFSLRTHGGADLVRAAVMSFGFVYIHPMVDGNGRISRFLINDSLRRDHAIPPPFVLPVSVTITRTASTLHSYDAVLERYSRPLMRTYADAWRFGDEQVGDDGVRYNLEFDGYRSALPTWRYPDLTEHVEYLAEVIHITIDREIHKEAVYLRDLRTARETVKNVLEGPDRDIDRIIRSVRDNDGAISNKLLREFPILQKRELADALVTVIRDSFGEKI